MRREEDMQKTIGHEIGFMSIVLKKIHFTLIGA
jgi:hypothetical protein